MIRRVSSFAATSLRRRLFEELERITIDPAYTVTVTHHGKPAAVFMNYDEYQSLLKTLEVAEYPEFVASGELNDMSEELKNGEILTYEEVFGVPQPQINRVDKKEVVYRLRHAAFREEKESSIMRSESEIAHPNDPNANY